MIKKIDHHQISNINYQQQINQIVNSHLILKNQNLMFIKMKNVYLIMERK